KGYNVNKNDEEENSFVYGDMDKDGKGIIEGKLKDGNYEVYDKLIDLVGIGGKYEDDKGKDNSDYIDDEFNEINDWESDGDDD
ncbi:hypothetical protein, partial [Vibrio crassostreae]|uniref:hypothetical protein n=1 Tax=Vibrio crassostreae TaxID=246167 RepID=UPI003D360A0E